MKCSGRQFFIGMLVLAFCRLEGVFAQQGTPSNLISSAYTSRPSKNLADIIALASNRPVLTELVMQAGVLSTLSTQSAYTFFAPTEEALKEIEYENSEKLRIIMLHHIVPGKYKLTDLKDGAKLQTLAGETITIFRKKEEILINGIPIIRGNENAKNGVMHTIGDVLKPKNL